MTRERLNELGGEILDSCVMVHSELGPGLFESVYVSCLLKELELRSITASMNMQVPLYYKGYDTGKYYVLDMLVSNEIIVEAEAVEKMHPIYDAQLINYLKLTDKRLGYLVNFNVLKLVDGYKPLVASPRLFSLKQKSDQSHFVVPWVPIKIGTRPT